MSAKRVEHDQTRALLCAAVLLWITALLSYSQTLNAAPVMTIDSARAAMPVERFIDVYVDSTNSLAIKDISRPEYLRNFAPLTSKRASFGFVNGTLWGRLRIANDGPMADQYAMHFLPVNVSLLNVYELSKARNGKPKKLFSYSDRAGGKVTRGTPGFLVPLGGLETGDSKQLIFEIKSDYPVDLDATVYTSFSVGTDMQAELSVHYFLLGCLLMLLFVGLSFLIYSADLIYLYYSLYLASVIGYFRHVWGFSALINRSDIAYSGGAYFLFSTTISIFLLLTTLRLIQGTRHLGLVRGLLYFALGLNGLALVGLYLSTSETGFYMYYGCSLLTFFVLPIALLPAYMETQANYILLFLVGALTNLLLALVSSITAMVDFSSLVTGSTLLGLISTMVAALGMLALGLFGVGRKESRRFGDLQESLQQQFNDDKSRLLNRVTAVMRTPVAALTGINSLLHATPLTTSQRELLQASDLTTWRLQQKLDDFNATMGLDSDMPLPKETFSPYAMLNELLLKWQPEIVSRQVLLEIEGDAAEARHIYAAERQIERIFAALLNAQLGRLRDARLSITLSITEKTLRLVIAESANDQLVPSEQTAPFIDTEEPFNAKVGEASEFLLALPQARELTSRIGGNLIAANNANGQLRLTLNLPIGDVETETSATEGSDDSVLLGLRVLLVHDDVVYRQLLERLFTSWGCSVETCSKLSEAQAHLRLKTNQGEAFELVLFDGSLHQSKLPHFIERLRNDLQIDEQGLAVLMLSADYSLTDARLASDLGVRRVIAVPVDSRELQHIVLEEVFALRRDRGQKRDNTDLSNCNVLVMESDALAAGATRLKLTDLGVEAHGVDDVHAALRALQRQRFDLVLAACDLPDGGGFELAEMARSWELESSRRPALIIGILNHEDEALRRRALLAGMDDTLLRPIYTHELHSALAHSLGSVKSP